MENQENCFAKTSSEAITENPCFQSCGRKCEKKNTKYAVNVFEGLVEFTQFFLQGIQVEGYKISKPLSGLLVYLTIRPQGRINYESIAHEAVSEWAIQTRP